MQHPKSPIKFLMSPHALLTHVCVTVVRLRGVFGGAVEKTIGRRFCHSVGEVIDLHIHIITERRHEKLSAASTGGYCLDL